MKHVLFFALLLSGQLAAPAMPAYKGVLVQPPYICGAQYVTRPLRIAVLGNSLAWSPPQPAFNWSQSNGMDASTLENDYAHIVCNALAERRHQSVALLVVQGWTIEAAVNTGTAWDRAYAEVITNYAPDVLVMQVSDNVTLDHAAQFETTYSELLAEMKPRQSLICLGTWYSSVAALSSTIQSACATHGGTFVAIGDIYTALNMRGSSFDDTVNAGVGSHPNDMGMLEIARRIVLAIEQ